MGQHKQPQTNRLLTFHPIRTFLLLLSFIVLSTDVIQAKVLESKTFDTDFGEYTITVESDDIGDSVNDIIIVYEDGLGDGYTGIVTAFNRLHYDVYDDTGKVITQFNYKHIGLYAETMHRFEVDEEGDYISELHSPVCDYVEQLITKYDTDIKIENRRFEQTLSHYGEIIHSAPSMDWMKRTELIYTTKYGKIYNTGNIDTEDGPYRVYMHNTDDNDKNFEVVSIVNKDGTIRHRVTSVIAFTLKTDGYVSDYEEGIYRIDIADPTGRHYVICNKELWETLVKLSQTTDYNNAYKLFDRHAVIHDADPTTGKIKNLHFYNPK